MIKTFKLKKIQMNKYNNSWALVEVKYEVNWCVMDYYGLAVQTYTVVSAFWSLFTHEGVDMDMLSPLTEVIG